MKSAQLDCSQVQAQLPLYAGGDLEAPWSEAVAGHLEQCAACVLELNGLRAALAPFDELRAVPVPTIDVWPGVRAALEREGHLGVSTSRVVTAAPRVAARAPYWRRAATSAAAAAAIVATVYVWWPEQRASSPAAGQDEGAHALALESSTSSATGVAVAQETNGVAPEPVESMPAGDEQLNLGRLRRAAPNEYMGLEAQLFAAPRFGESDAGASLASDRVQRGLR